MALNTRRYDEIDQWLIDPSDPSSPSETEFNRLCVTSRRARHLGDVELALLLAGQAIAVTKASPSQSTEPSAAYAAYSLAGQSIGEFNKDNDNETLRIACEEANNSSIVTAYGSLALAAAEASEFEEAGSYADKALAYATEPVVEWFHQPLASLLSKSMAQRANGRIGDAEAMAQRVEGIAEMGVEPLMLTRIRCHLAVLAHEQGHAEPARNYLRTAKASVADSSGPLELQYQIRETHNQELPDLAAPQTWRHRTQHRNCRES